MIKNSLIITVLFVSSILSAKQWVEVYSDNPLESSFAYESDGLSSTKITFKLSGYFKAASKNGLSITSPGGVSMLEKGAPDLPIFTTSIQIPDLAGMELDIIESDYVEININDIIPSKGNVTRDINISSLPFEKGYRYEQNNLYPAEISFLRRPHIIRSVRGQTIVFQPFQYNPVRGVLRIYTDIVLRVEQNSLSADNPLTRYPAKNRGVREMEEIYSNHFPNYMPVNGRYTPLDENGSMLIICHGPFIEAMQPFIDWKVKKGIETTLVDVSSIGDAEDIKVFVEEYYYNHGINFLLLVGDIAQIPSPRFSEGAGSNSPSDTYYGFIPAEDYYPDVFVGRFSAETEEHVNTMVSRTVFYERYPDIEDGSWYMEGAGFASNEGPGDGGEYDNEHMDIIRQKLLEYNYNDVEQVYDPSGTVAQGEFAINEGMSIINYTGHGSNGSWGNGCPMNNTNVNSLTNAGMWPWIWSVACVNGEFHIGTCFAETWLRATDVSGNPTGAIATLMSTINQAWNPPMNGQDEMIDIFIESYENNIKRTFGGLSYNGCMKMNDNYGSEGEVETLYWTTFGDPSFVVRSSFPEEIIASHSEVIILGGSQLIVQTNSHGSVAALSKNGVILSVATANEDGVCRLNLDVPIEVPGSLDLVVTSYNHVPYESEINVIAPEGSYMLLNHFSLSSENSEVVDFSELGALSVSLENVGTESSGLVYASVTPQTDNVNILTSPILTDSVAAGGIAEVGPFEFNVSINSLNQDEILLNLVLVDDINSWQYPISFRVNAPDYNMVSSSILDGGNNALDPGENVTLRIVIENIGNAPLNYPTFDMFENDNYILVEELNADNAYFWEVGSSVVLSAVVSISEDAPVGHTAIAWIDIGSLNTSYESMISIPLNIGMLMDNFETEDFSSHDWSFAGQGEWFIQSDQVFDGNYAARSGAVSNNQSSELLVDYNVLNQGYIRFNAKVSSEQGSSGTPYDHLNFYIDNEELVLVGGDSDWAEYSYLVSPGQHTFKWVYEKDNAGLSGDDCAWIDNVIFPPGSIPPLNIDFGDLNQDENINVLDVILTVSSVLGYGVLSEEQKIAADINMDGLVNIVDVTLIIDMLFAN